jgi:hypothetical protein
VRAVKSAATHGRTLSPYFAFDPPVFVLIDMIRKPSDGQLRKLALGLYSLVILLLFYGSPLYEMDDL